MSDALYAYHEAGHAVAAAVWDSRSVHPASISIVTESCSSPFSDLQANQTRMVIVLFAGLLAQKKYRPDSSNNSAADDELKIDQYLGAIYRTDTTSELIARNYLKQEAERLVHEFGNAITAVAEALWAKEWTTRIVDWRSALPLEKTVGAPEIFEILKEWNIPCSIDDSTIEDQPTTVAD